MATLASHKSRAKCEESALHFGTNLNRGGTADAGRKRNAETGRPMLLLAIHWGKLGRVVDGDA